MSTHTNSLRAIYAISPVLSKAAVKIVIASATSGRDVRLDVGASVQRDVQSNIDGPFFTHPNTFLSCNFQVLQLYDDAQKWSTFEGVTI